MLQERLRAGLTRAKGEGKRFGRSRISSPLQKRIVRPLWIPGRPGVRKIAARFGFDRDCLLLRLCGCTARQAYREHRALAQLARHRHIGTHHARELAGDGKADKANAAPRCGVRSKRTGKPCQGAAMPNGRCKLHGGKSTGPRTMEGLERSRRANWKHGHFSREAKAERSRLRGAMLAVRYLRDSI